MSHLGDKHLGRIAGALERQTMLEEYRLLRELSGQNLRDPLPDHQRARLTWLAQQLWPEYESRANWFPGSTKTG